ncbi:hypothetical protein, partial [Cognatishimia sp.]|uniref:hypothetical protein n=1 Tax=Cognatishimia sp. TaxID=2211648 RepID=UPI0035114238
LIHPGFHKTGTSSLQTTMRKNADVIAPWVRVNTLEETKDLRLAAWLFARNADAEMHDLLRETIQAFFAQFDPDDTRDLLISEEDLAGSMPGRHGKTTYDKAGQTLSILIQELSKTGFAGHDLHVLLTLRDTKAWAKSCYSQHLRSRPMTLDLESYLQSPAAACDLATNADEIAKAIAPVPVHCAWLEDIGARRLGPAEAAIDLLPQLSKHRAVMEPTGITNGTLPKELAAIYLDLNRQDLDPMELKQAKLQARKAFWRARRQAT